MIYDESFLLLNGHFEAYKNIYLFSCITFLIFTELTDKRANEIDLIIYIEKKKRELLSFNVLNILLKNQKIRIFHFFFIIHIP